MDSINGRERVPGCYKEESMTVRLLSSGDRAAAEALLLAHADSSLSLLAALQRGGVQSGSWAGLFADGALRGLAAHLEAGSLMIQAPCAADRVAVAAVEASRRAVSAILGPWEHAVAARAALGLAGAEARVDEREVLFALELGALRVPPFLAAGAVLARAPRSDEVEQVVKFRLDYSRELGLGVADAAAAGLVRASFPASLDARNLFLAVADDTPVALTSFNARAAGRVQVAGVYTPPELRGRGYARCAVAGHLLEARAAGATRAVLFTRALNLGAQRAYQALGFEPIGSYAVIVL